jgi:zeaxanthin glucosyltransferase
MRFGFAAPPVAGHLNPMIALAAHLKSRGHEAVFFNFLDTEPRFREVNMPFLSYGAERFPSGDLARRTSHLSRLSGAEAMQFTFQMLTDSCLASLEDGARVTREWQADALIIDTAQRGFDLVAMHLGVPYVHLSNALHLDYWGSTPLCFYDWPYEEGPAALARNRKGLEMLRQLTTPLTEIQREYARHAGLELDWDDLARMISKRAWLTQCPKELDFPSDHWPDYFHHVGPLHNGAARAPVEFPWERLSGEPLIYASMGTLQNGAEAVFRVVSQTRGVDANASTGLSSISGSDAECALNEARLSNDVAFCEPADLAFPDDVHRLVSRNRVERPVNGTEPLARHHSFFHETMVLFDDVVQVR